MDWSEAVKIAQALLDEQRPGVRAATDPGDVYTDGAVFVVPSYPIQDDDMMLVVDAETGQARFVVAPPYEPHPFPDLSPVEDVPEGDGLVIVDHD